MLEDGPQTCWANSLRVPPHHIHRDCQQTSPQCISGGTSKLAEIARYSVLTEHYQSWGTVHKLHHVDDQYMLTKGKVIGYNTKGSI